jgi:hypothetical protein
VRSIFGIFGSQVTRFEHQESSMRVAVAQATKRGRFSILNLEENDEHSEPGRSAAERWQSC